MRDDYDLLIADAAERWQVPFTWVKAVISTESDFRPDAYRAEPRINDGSYGLMQVLYRTAQGLGYQGPPEGLFDPSVNVDLGTKLLGQLRGRYGDDFAAVYSAYNSGSPTAYKTNTQVAAHVARAVARLAEVEGSVTTVTPDSGGNVNIGILLLLAAVIGYIAWRWQS